MDGRVKTCATQAPKHGDAALDHRTKRAGAFIATTEAHSKDSSVHYLQAPFMISTQLCTRTATPLGTHVNLESTHIAGLMARTCLFGAKQDPTPTSGPGQRTCLVLDSIAITSISEAQSPMKGRLRFCMS